MKTVLFAWELGDGLGHAAPLVALADVLMRRNPDLQPVFVFRDPLYTRSLLAGREWPIIPAPVLTASSGGQTSDMSHAQLLLSMGFNRPHELAAAMATWDDLFATVRPDLVVAEHSPTACLAARGRVPVLVTGTAFTVPPADTNIFPPFRRGVEPPAMQRRMCDIINGVLQRRGQPVLARLPELLAGNGRAIFSLPHLDPYGPLRKDRLLGPYHGRLKPRPVPDDRSIYFYSRADVERLDDMVGILLDLGMPISAFISGPDSVARTLLRNRGARIFERMPDLAEAVGAARLVVSHGGAGVVSAALLVGRAQVITPIYVESEVTAMRVDQSGAAMVVLPSDEEFARSFGQAIETVAQVRLFHERAQETADEIAALDMPDNPLAEAASIAERLLQS